MDGAYAILVENLMVKQIFTRNFVCGALLALLLSQTVNWRLCTIERGKYLLGIYYNGNYQNNADGIVYEDYLKTHGITHEFIKENI
jgi:hypothetical protein